MSTSATPSTSATQSTPSTSATQSNTNPAPKSNRITYSTESIDPTVQILKD